MNKAQKAILSLSWQSIAYGVGVFGSQLIVFILVPFLTRYMPQAEYGVVSILISLYAFLNVFTNAGMPLATYRFYNGADTEKDKHLILGGSQFLFFIFAILPAILIIIFPGTVSTILLDSDRYAPAMQLVAAYLIINSMNTFGYVILRIDQRPLVSSFHSIFLITCNTGFALLFVIGFKMGVTGYWLGYLIGEFLGFLLMVWLVRKRISFEISFSTMGEMLKYSLPLIPATLSLTALRVADRYIIGSLAGLDKVAIYDVGYKVGSIILLLIAPFRNAWSPFSFSIANKPEAPKIYKDVLNYMMAICSFLILGVFAFRVEIIKILAPATYQDAASVVGWVASAQLFLAVYWIFSIGPLNGNKTHYLAWVSLISGVINVGLNFLLIPRIGILGAAIATFVSYALLAILTYFASRLTMELKLDWVRLGKLLLVVGCITFAIIFSEKMINVFWIRIFIKLVGLALFPILLLVVRFVSPFQIKGLLNFINNKVIGKFEPQK